MERNYVTVTVCIPSNCGFCCFTLIVTCLWLWPATDHEPHCRHVPINKIWRQTESTPRSRRWCSHMATIYSDCSTHKIIVKLSNCHFLWASVVAVARAWIGCSILQSVTRASTLPFWFELWFSSSVSRQLAVNNLQVYSDTVEDPCGVLFC